MVEALADTSLAMERSDRKLLAATVAGDADAFGALFRRRRRRLSASWS
jgi:hypothetical protein